MDIPVQTWKYNAGSGVASVAVSADGKTIIAGTLGKEVICLDGAGSERWKARVGNQAWQAALSADGYTAIVGTGSTRPWDLGGRGLHCFGGDGSELWGEELKASVWGLAISADGKTVAVGTAAKQLLLFDSRGNRLWLQDAPSFDWYAPVWSAALSDDGNTVVVGASDKKVRLFERSGKVLAEHRARAEVFTVSISAGGQDVAAGDSKGYIYWLNRQGHLLWEERLSDNVWRVSLSADGRCLLVGAGEKESHIRAYNRAGQEMWRRYVRGSVSALALSRDGRRVVAGTRDGGIHIFGEDGAVLHKGEADKIIRWVAISDLGEVVVAGSEDEYVYGFSIPLLDMPSEADTLSPFHTEYLRRRRKRLGEQLSTWENRVAALERDVSLEMDSERKVVLDERLIADQEKCGRVLAELADIERQLAGGDRELEREKTVREAELLPSPYVAFRGVRIKLSRWRIWLAGSGGLLAVILLLVVGLAALNNALTPTLGIGSTMIREKDGAVMVYVPAGEFTMGSSEGDGDTDDNEHPQYTIYVDAFWIDKTEVTNAQYKKCVEAGACTPSEYANDERFNGDNQPVVGVDWHQAKTYAGWAGGRLPTEAEWEKAARGTDGRKYPWGHDFDGAKLNFCDKNCEASWKDDNADDGYVYTAPVGSYPAGASPYGALDMAGNVYEWTSSLYWDYPYQADDGRENLNAEGNRTLRGGSWDDYRRLTRVSYRGSGHPDFFNGSFGFRLCVVARQD